MKQRFLCLVTLCLPLLLMAQEEKSAINWTTNLTWQQVKEKAKKENKYIFIDCFTTWCKPCREMDMKVYTVDSVGEFLNKGFISVKLQMDETKNDRADVKSWYRTARNMESQYRINAYPSFVFFAPDGDVVSKETGYKDPAHFIQVARNATDLSKQYFVLLKKYKQGKLDHSGTVSLIMMAQQIGDTADYHNLLNSYYSYLHKQPKQKLYTKENIEFIASTLERSSQVLFDMFYPDGREVNKVLQNDWYAKKVVDKIIRDEKLQLFLNTSLGGTDPDWNSLYRWIAKDYGDDYAGRNVLEAKLIWHQRQNNWLKFASCLNDKIEKYGTDTTDRGDEFRLNRRAGDIWEYLGPTKELSNEIITELSRVCVWMEGVVRRGGTATGERLQQWPMYIDTYANLLHKIGRTAEAIKWEEFAMLKCKEFGGGKDDIGVYEYYLDKMKKGEPSWPIEKK